MATNPLPVFFPGEFHGQRSMAGYSPWGPKELDKTERIHTQSDCLLLKIRGCFVHIRPSFHPIRYPVPMEAGGPQRGDQGQFLGEEPAGDGRGRTDFLADTICCPRSVSFFGFQLLQTGAFL